MVELQRGWVYPWPIALGQTSQDLGTAFHPLQRQRLSTKYWSELQYTDNNISIIS